MSYEISHALPTPCCHGVAHLRMAHSQLCHCYCHVVQYAAPLPSSPRRSSLPSYVVPWCHTVSDQSRMGCQIDVDTWRSHHTDLTLTLTLTTLTLTLTLTLTVIGYLEVAPHRKPSVSPPPSPALWQCRCQICQQCQIGIGFVSDACGTTSSP